VNVPYVQLVDLAIRHLPLNVTFAKPEKSPLKLDSLHAQTVLLENFHSKVLFNVFAVLLVSLMIILGQQLASNVRLVLQVLVVNPLQAVFPVHRELSLRNRQVKEIVFPAPLEHFRIYRFLVFVLNASQGFSKALKVKQAARVVHLEGMVIFRCKLSVACVLSENFRVC